MSNARQSPSTPSSRVIESLEQDRDNLRVSLRFAMNAMIDAQEKGGEHVIPCERVASVIKDANAALKRSTTLGAALHACESETAAPFTPAPPAVRVALLALLNHVEPGWENCRAVVQAWLDGELP